MNRRAWAIPSLVATLMVLAVGAVILDASSDSTHAQGGDEHRLFVPQIAKDAGDPTPDPSPTPTAEPELGTLTVHYIDVGQADATLLEGPDFTILIDAGHWQRNDVVPYLTSV